MALRVHTDAQTSLSYDVEKSNLKVLVYPARAYKMSRGLICRFPRVILF